MSIQSNGSGVRANVGWAIGSAILLALVAAFALLLRSADFLLPLRLLLTPVAILLLPPAVVWLDGRSHTWVATALLLACLIAASILWGWSTAAIGIFIGLAASAAAVVKALKVPYHRALLTSAIVGVVGALLGVVVLGLHRGQPLNEWAADLFCRLAQSVYVPGMPGPLDVFVVQEKLAALPVNEQMQLAQITNQLSQSVAMGIADKIAIARPVLVETFSLMLPSTALTMGLFAGGVAYWAPMFLLNTRKAVARGRNMGLVPVPPFAAFRIPVYAVVAMWLVELAASIATAAQWGNFAAVNSAASELLNLLMTLQAMALFSFLLNRKRVSAPVQAVILIPAALLFSWLMVVAGVVDVLFNIRGLIRRMDQVKAQGKQVMTPEGLEEMQRLEQEERQKNDKDKNDREGDEK